MLNRVWARPQAAVNGLICIGLAAPFFWFRDVPLFDLPVHIARQHIVFDPAFDTARHYYEVDWRLLPNLALDLFVYVIHFILPIDGAIRFFLALTAVQMFLGALALNHALFDREHRFGVAAGIFVFNGPFLLGFVNLSFGLGLSLWVLALWLRFRGRKASWLVFSVLGSAILFAHFFAFATYALIIGVYGVTEGVTALRAGERLRPVAVTLLHDAAHLVVPIFIYAILMPRGLRESSITASSLFYKLGAALSVAGIYDAAFDVMCLLVLLCGFILVRRKLVLARPMIVPVLALIAAFLVLPHGIGRASYVDYRIPSALVLVLTGSTGWRGTTKTRFAIECALVVFFLFRTATMASEWSRWQPVFAECRAAFQKMPPGARLLALGSRPNVIDGNEHPPLAHLDAIAVTERQAFIPTMLADRPYELLRYAPEVSELKAEFFISPNVKDYDYVLILHPENTPIPSDTKEIARGEGFVLAKVLP